MTTKIIEFDPIKDSANVPYSKRSFLKLPVTIDVNALLADYQSIPPEAWSTSHWNIHCSSNMLLLRGGQKGTEEDFTTSEVRNSEILAKLPYLSWLISEEGPFGQVTYAFIFRMKPMGVSRPHIDDKLAWKDPFRIHIPITTNNEAFLLAEGRAKHIPVGEVWTFDNQSLHAVLNGNSVRTHLIMDVHHNPKLDALLDASEWDPGSEDPERWNRTYASESPPILAPAHSDPISATEKVKLGLNLEGFASRISKRRWIAQMTRAPIRKGDVIYAVNGVEECPIARTTTDYIHLRHQPGETIQLGLIRDGKRVTEKLTLYRNRVPRPIMSGLWRLAGAVNYR